MLIPLMQTTIRTPREAAEQILGFALSRDVLWSALALVSAVNTVLLVVFFNLTPPPPEGADMPAIPSLFFNPLPLFVMQTGVLVVLVHALYWTGKALGGKGDLADMLSLTIWFSVLGAVLRLVTVALLLVAPVAASLFSILASLWSLWIFLNFIHIGMRLPNIGYAVATLVLGSVGMLFGLVLLLAVILVLAGGAIGHV